MQSIAKLRVALKNLDQPAVFSSIVDLMRIGDMNVIAEELHFAEIEFGEDVFSLFHETLESASQDIFIDGKKFSLFCIPALVDANSDNLDVDGLRDFLCKFAGPQAHFCIVDGWIHLGDLVSLLPTEYFNLTQHIAEQMSLGKTKIAIDNNVFPQSPVTKGQFGGGLDFSGLRSRPSCATRQVIGMVEVGSSELFDNILASNISDEERIILGDAFDAAGAKNAVIVETGKPIWSSVGFEATINCISLEARIEIATRAIGRKPIAVFCSDGGSIYISLTTDGETCVDFIVMCEAGLDPDVLRDIIDGNCAGVVVHPTQELVPRPEKYSAN